LIGSKIDTHRERRVRFGSMLLKEGLVIFGEQ
jgi:hypothetical protein